MSERSGPRTYYDALLTGHSPALDKVNEGPGPSGRSSARGAHRMLKIEKTIKKDWKKYTSSEQKLATFFLNHLSELPFETAASIAKRIDVSPMTVGRFIKKLGYADLRDIKDNLRASRQDNGWLSLQITKALFDDAPLNAKINALIDVHKIPNSTEWPRIVSLLATADKVNVASFHMGRFLGLGFSTALQSMRANTLFCDGSDGAYIDALMDSGPNSCLMIIDFRRYSRHFRLLAEEATARRIPIIIVTDAYCHWARELTDNVLMIETGAAVSWESLSLAQVLFEMLLSHVARELKGREKRYEAIHELREKFIGFAGTDGASSRGKPRRNGNGKDHS